MRLALVLSLALGSTAVSAAPAIRIVNEARLPAAQIAEMRRDYGRWAQRVYAYHRLSQPPPVNLVITRQVGIGYYLEPNVYLPPDEDPDEMLETWVHELTHHATGHGSSFFFKEGIATHGTEALFAEDGRRVEGWPQYGVSNDAWVSRFLARGELPPLRQMIDQPGYDGSSREADYRSWQTYIAAASFLGWLIRSEGYERFQQAFREQSLGRDAAAYERRWLAAIQARNLPAFDVVRALPSTSRYRYYARRLEG